MSAVAVPVSDRRGGVFIPSAWQLLASAVLADEGSPASARRLAGLVLAAVS